MSIDLETRRKQLESLSAFITDAREKILDITKGFQWDIKSLEQKKEMVCCPFDDGHIIPKSSLESHIEQCKFKKQSYHPEDIPFPPLAVSSSSPSVLKVDKELLVSILRQAKEKNPAMILRYPDAIDDRDVPMTSDRFMSSLTSDEKAAIHSYVIENTVSSGEGKDVSFLEQDIEKNFKNKKEEKRDKTPLEKLIEERDAKRRREGKKVHINRKSHTEIIREVIENQMEIYVEWLKDENLIKREGSEPGQLEASGNHSDGEIADLDVKQEYDSGSCFSDKRKSFENERKQRNLDPEERQRNYHKREINEYPDSWRRSDTEKYRESRSRSHYSRDSGSKKYWDSESSSYRENERRQYKEYDYKKSGGKYRADEKGDSGRLRGAKLSTEKYWDGGAHFVKDHVLSDEEDDRESKRRRRHGEKSNNGKKREKEKRHHRSERPYHSSDSDNDSRTYYRKEKYARRK